MAVQNPPVKGGFEPPVMSFSGVVCVHAYVYTLEHTSMQACYVWLVAGVESEEGVGFLGIYTYTVGHRGIHVYTCILGYTYTYIWIQEHATCDRVLLQLMHAQGD
jgi:hypothetical protein